jgi:hypothetical protein
MLRFTHLGFGDHLEAVMLTAGQTLALDVRMSSEAIELAPLLVEGRSDLDERRRTSGHGINEVEEFEIDRAARSGLTLRELLQTTMPGTLASQGGLSGTCVQYRAIRSGGDTGCMEVTVILDGVQVANPGYIYETMPLNSISRLEMLSPGQAGVRYGTAAGQAVLLIETRRGPQMQRAIDARFVTGMAWNEAAPYHWRAVVGSTGGTDVSRGRVGPSSFAGGVVLTGGYLLIIHGGEGARATGFALLSVGVPVAIALADRVFRTIR